LLSKRQISDQQNAEEGESLMPRTILLTIALTILLRAASAQSGFPSLLANGPSSQYREKLELFGQFVGSWTFEGVEYHDDGSHPTDVGEIHCQWVLQGRAVQDVFLETKRSDNDSLLYGSTIRFFDPKIDAWRITWINPAASVVRTFIGRKVGTEIVMEGASEDGTPLHWIFSQITAKSFHWRGEKQTQSGWRIYEELTAHRKR
jgi:hypothetical protein